MTAFTFRKPERLNRKKLIEQLFARGSSFFIYPYKVIWLLMDAEHPYPAQVLISVSKRAMKRAVARNSVKRQIRELYRHKKHEIYAILSEKGRHALIGIIYTGSEKLPFELAEQKINQVMARLLKEMRKQLER
jgi:ribonuclease P protein component